MQKIKGIFFHIAKAAGTSQIEVVNKYKHLMLFDTSSWIQYLDKYPDANINNIFTWTFTRHPFDRIASIYGAWQLKEKQVTIKDILNLAMLGQALNWKITESFHVSNDIIASELWQKTDMNILEHLIPCHKYIDTWERILSNKLNFIGQFENLQTHWEYVCGNVDILDRLPNKNKSTHRKWSSYLEDKKLKDLAYEIYKEDFIRYGYKP